MTLKNDEAVVRMLYLSGNQELIRTCLRSLAVMEGFNSASEESSPSVLRIAQRMRLESSQLETVQWKLREPTNYCMCLALAANPPPQLQREGEQQQNPTIDAARNSLILQENFINYLQEKMAAGIISFPSSQEVIKFIIQMFFSPFACCHYPANS